MSWSEDPLVWANLDKLMLNSWTDLKDFLDALNEYSPELDNTIKAMLFGGLGQLTVSYVEARQETNSPKHSLAIALEHTTQNPLFAALLEATVHNAVDRAMGA